MKLRWYEKSKWRIRKQEAIKLRKKGLSIGKIEQRLGIRRSTLSGWFKDVQLSKKQKEKLLHDWKNGLIKARKKAVFWHNEQKEKRLRHAKDEARKTLKNLDLDNPHTFELALAMLYLGEGSKRNVETAIGSSDPMILKFFLKGLQNLYNLDLEKIRCELYLRADQDPDKMKSFWSYELRLPLNAFKQVNIDKRTIGSKTYPQYKGVCNLRCANVAIQRKLIFLSELFCKGIIDKTVHM